MPGGRLGVSKLGCKVGSGGARLVDSKVACEADDGCGIHERYLDQGGGIDADLESKRDTYYSSVPQTPHPNASSPRHEKPLNKP